MTIWQGLSDDMDAIVDANLGDLIRYSIAGAPYRTLAGFVLFESPSFAVDDIDELAVRPRVKISKELVARPVKMDRIQCEKRLGPGTWCPSGKQPGEQGRYWIFDIQKVTP